MKFLREGKHVDADDRVDLTHAIHRANMEAEPYPNLFVRVTVEIVNRPVTPKSEWRRRRDLNSLVEVTQVKGAGVMYRAYDGNSGYVPLSNWHDTFEWISDP